MTEADGAFSFLLDRQQVAGKRLLFEARVQADPGIAQITEFAVQAVMDVTYSIIDFGPVGNEQIEDLLIDPPSTAALQILQKTGLEDFNINGIKDVVSQIRAANEDTNFGGQTADGAVTLATQKGGADSAVQGTIQSAFVCRGDCNQNGTVTPDEALTMVGIALGLPQVGGCESGDIDLRGSIAIDEILLAVKRAVDGCAQRGH